MKNILVPTDFSTTAWNAINYALLLFSDTDCAFYFLNTYTPEISSSRFMADTIQHNQQDPTAAIASEKGLEETIQKIKKDSKNPRHAYTVISSFSLLSHEVKEAVVAYDIDLIIMGTNGASSKENIFMGRNTVKVSKSIRNCPVLVIPKHFKFKFPKKIAFVTDFSRFYTSMELAPLLEMARIFHTAVVVVNVKEDTEELTELQRFNYEALNKNLGGISHSFYSISAIHPLPVSLQLFMDKFNIQLLAMSNCSNSYLDRFCRELVIDRSVFHSNVPLLVIPEMEKLLHSGKKSIKNTSLMSKSE